MKVVAGDKAFFKSNLDRSEVPPSLQVCVVAKAEGTGRVPHVRTSVRGPKTVGAALRPLFLTGWKYVRIFRGVTAVMLCIRARL
jgi:hypothetical protein